MQTECSPFEKLLGDDRMFMQYTVMEGRSAIGVSPVPFGPILQQKLHQSNIANLHIAQHISSGTTQYQQPTPTSATTPRFCGLDKQLAS